jgi:hypothetical protein
MKPDRILARSRRPHMWEAEDRARTQKSAELVPMRRLSPAFRRVAWSELTGRRPKLTQSGYLPSPNRFTNSKWEKFAGPLRVKLNQNDL